MIPGISTQVFLPERLTTGLLDALRAGGAGVVELWAARYHFDYTDRGQVREVAGWFRGNEVRATLHMPLTADTEFSRHATPTVNLVDGDKGRRIAAMDEVKRAMECAEQVPVRACVVHLGTREDKWDERVMEHALVAVEHLKAFAGPLGVKLLLENLRNEVATPAHLLEILRVGHFEGCGVCLDVGHAHLAAQLGDAGIEEAFAVLGGRVGEVHLSDNAGKADDHLWPASGAERDAGMTRGSVEWAQVYGLTASLAPETAGVLEIAAAQGGTAGEVTRRMREVLAWQARLAEGQASDEEEARRRGKTASVN